MTLLSRHRILNNSPGGLRPNTLPLVCWGSPKYLRLMTPRSLGSKFHHLRASCNLLTNVLSCFWSVTLMERQSSTKAFGDERDWVLALSTWERNRVALWQTLAFHSQRNDSMVLISSTDLSHFPIRTCASPFPENFIMLLTNVISASLRCTRQFSLPTMLMLCPWLKLQRSWFSWHLLAGVMASRGGSGEVSVSWYIAAPSPALLWRLWSLALNPP